MIKPIVKDILFLGQKSEPATKDDAGVIQDLIDTLKANIGGLGTLIASMASLISYKFIAQKKNVSKGKYLLFFTIANIIFLAALMLLYVIIK